MVKTKMKSLSVLAMALVMAFALCFSISNFSKNSASAAATEVVICNAATSAITFEKNQNIQIGTTGVTYNLVNFTSTKFSSGTTYKDKYYLKFGSNNGVQGLILTLPANTKLTFESQILSTQSNSNYVGILDSAQNSSMSASKIKAGLAYVQMTGVSSGALHELNYVFTNNTSETKTYYVVSQSTSNTGFYTLKLAAEKLEVAPPYVVEGDTLTATGAVATLPEQEKDGYNFIGWAKDGALVTSAANGDVLTAVYAKNVAAAGTSIRVGTTKAVRYGFKIEGANLDLLSKEAILDMLDAKITVTASSSKNVDVTSISLVEGDVYFYATMVNFDDANNRTKVSSSAVASLNGVDLASATNTAYSAYEVAQEYADIIGADCLALYTAQ